MTQQLGVALLVLLMGVARSTIFRVSSVEASLTIPDKARIVARTPRRVHLLSTRRHRWPHRASAARLHGRNIQVQGLQRISEGTVFNYLPVNIGDHLDAQRVREALRALYATGFFRDVELRRDGDTLIVAVAERPSLESIDIKGNKDIKTEDLQNRCAMSVWPQARLSTARRSMRSRST